MSRVPDTGEWEKVETQHEDNLKVLDRLGAELGKPLDDGISAWKKGVRRPGWDELLDRVRQGLSDGVVIWHTDRLFRQPRDLETLIDLADKGFAIYSARGRRDLSDPDDRFILRIEVAHAARSSDDTQRRIKRRQHTLREKGIPHRGPRRFGRPGKDRTWQPPEGDSELPLDERAQRPEVAPTLVAAERGAIADAAETLLAGVQSLEEVAKDWNARGLTTATGLLWVGNGVRDVMLRASNAGLIEHYGNIVGPSTEDPIIDVSTWERLRAKFAARRRGRVPSMSYVGTGILRCGLCGAKLTSRTYARVPYPDGTKSRQYYCAANRRGCGKVAADMRRVDEELRTFVVARLSDSRFAEAVSAARAQVSDRLDEVTAEITECERLQEELAAKLGRRELTLKAFETANAPLAESLHALYAERDKLSGGSPEGPTAAQPAEVIAQQWDSAEPAERRALFTQALGQHTMVIDPAIKDRKRKWDPARVRIADHVQAAA